MSFRKTRVHHTGLSNADRNSSSLSPIKERIPLHEPKKPTNPKTMSFESPVDSTVQKYKTWQKSLKSEFISQPPNEPKLSLKTDPPDFANFRKSEINAKSDQRYFPISVTEQFSNFLNTNGINLRSKFVQFDKERKSGINSQEFSHLLDSVHAPQVLLKNSERLFKELVGGEKVLRYSQVEPLNVRNVESPENRFVDKEKLRDNEIIEKQKAAPNQLELIFNRGNRLRNALKSKYNCEKDLVRDLENHSKNDRIQMQDLKNFVLNKIGISVQDNEIKGLLSAYDYNKDRQTDANEVAKYIFMDNNSAADYLHVKKRPIAPTRVIEQFPNRSPSVLKPLLLHIEQKMFTQGSNKFLPVFKAFDRDNDGYLTIEDLEQGLKVNQIPYTQPEVQGLFSFLDENSNGFVTFQEFSKKIQPNIITVNRISLKETELAHINLSQPSTVFYEMQKSRLPPLINANSDHVLNPSSRYSSSPPYKDTFPSFAPGRQSPMFISDNQRYYTKRFDPLNFGHEDKLRAKKTFEAKLEGIQKLRDAQETRVKILDSQKFCTDEENVKVKKFARQEYERKCKSGLMS